jgi:hypothetical protein
VGDARAREKMAVKDGPLGKKEMSAQTGINDGHDGHDQRCHAWG